MSSRIQDVIKTSAHASRDAAAKAGHLFLPTDAYAIQRDTGSAYEQWGPAFKLTVPSDSGFAWVNQGTSAIATVKDALVLTGGATGSGANVSLRVKTAPAAPWTLTVCILPTMANKPFQSYGICFRESSSGKLHVLDVLTTDLGLTTPFIRSTKYTNATTFSADYTSTRLSNLINWLRITDDNTNRKCYWSGDGQNWLQLDSQTRTDFLTADQYGLVVGTENSLTPNFAPILNCVSLAVT